MSPRKFTIEGIPDLQALQMVLDEIKANAPKVPVMHRALKVRQKFWARHGRPPNYLFISRHDWDVLRSENDWRTVKLHRSVEPGKLPLLPEVDGMKIVVCDGPFAMRAVEIVEFVEEDV